MRENAEEFEVTSREHGRQTFTYSTTQTVGSTALDNLNSREPKSKGSRQYYKKTFREGEFTFPQNH